MKLFRPSLSSFCLPYLHHVSKFFSSGHTQDLSTVIGVRTPSDFGGKGRWSNCPKKTTQCQKTWLLYKRTQISVKKKRSQFSCVMKLLSLFWKHSGIPSFRTSKGKECWFETRTVREMGVKLRVRFRRGKWLLARVIERFEKMRACQWEIGILLYFKITCHLARE